MVMSRNHSFTAAVCVGLIFALIFSVGAFAEGNAPPEDTPVLPDVLYLRATSVGSEILILWVEPQDPEEIVAGYKVYLDSGDGYDTDGEFVPKGTSHHLIRELEPGDYEVRVTTVGVSEEETGSPETQGRVAGGRGETVGHYTEYYTKLYGGGGFTAWLSGSQSGAAPKSMTVTFYITQSVSEAGEKKLLFSRVFCR